MKKLFYSCLLLISFAFLFTSSNNIFAVSKFNDDEKINIRIEQSIGNPTKLNITLKGSYTLNSKKFTSTKFDLSIQDGKIKLNDGKTVYSYSDIKLVPSKEDSTHLITINNNFSYMGEMSFQIEKALGTDKKELNSLQPINTLSINNYLQGVVRHEMPPSWKEEALKSQTVAARTYLYKNKSNSKFDDTIYFQVYKGFTQDSYTATIKKVVNETKNEVLLYKGSLAETFYSSSNGGVVNSTKDYGWNELAYSTAKCDPYDPKNSFKSVISEKTLIDNVLKNSSVKEIYKITYSETGVNGRASKVYFETNIGKLELSINTFRSRLNYDSLKNTLITKSHFDGDNLTVEGYGWGHGIGMSQYGAQSMANKGLNYKDILGFYYSGTTLNNKTISYIPTIKSDCKIKISTSNVSSTPTVPSTNNSSPTKNTQNTTKNNTNTTPTTSSSSPTKKYVVNTKSGTLSLRQNANTTSKVLAQIPKGKEVQFIKDENTKWLKVKYNGKTGFVSKDFIKIETVKKTTSTNNTNTTKNTSSTTSKTYTVKKGDTLYRISVNTGVSVSKLKQLNNLKNDNIKIGQVLKVK